MPDNMNPENVNLALESAEQYTREIIDRLSYVPLVGELRGRLKHSPSWARYHQGTQHSEDVLHEAILFAVFDGIKEPEDFVDIALASLGHDIALTEDPKDSSFVPSLAGHEQRGADFMRQKMREAGYPEDRVIAVAESIEDTRLVNNEAGFMQQQQARHNLGRYLLDADVSNFGRSDFSQKSDLVYEELGLLGVSLAKDNFLQGTLGLISNHVWQTKAATILRQPQQEINIANCRLKAA